MLKDRFFYPLAAGIVALMIGIALSFGEGIELTDCQIWQSGFMMDGEDLVRLTAQPGTQAAFIAASAGEPAYARLTSTAARENLPPGPGVFAPLGPQYERAFATRTVRMTVTARTSRLNGLKDFDIGYFSAGSGDSGWKREALSTDWTNYSLVHKIGVLTDGQGIDHASVWPGETAELLNVDVRAIRVEVLDPPEGCAN